MIGRRSLIWGYLGQALNIGAGLLVLPVMLRVLDSPHIAIWFVFTALTGLVALLDFGFQPTIIRNTAYVFGGARELLPTGIGAKADDGSVSPELLDALIRTSRRIYAVVAGAALLLLITAGSAYILWLARELADQASILLAWVIYSISVCFNFYFTFLTPLLYGRGKVVEANKPNVVSRAFFVVVASLALWLGYGLVGLACANLVSGVIARVLLYRVFYDADLSALLATSSRSAGTVPGLFRVLWHNSSRMGLVMLGTFLILRANTIICSTAIGLDETARYALTMQVFAVLTATAAVAFSVYTPTISQMRLHGDSEGLRRVVGVATVLSLGTFMAGGLLIVLAGPALIAALGGKTGLLPLGMLWFAFLFHFLEVNHSNFAGVVASANEVPFVRAALYSGAAIVVLSLLLVLNAQIGVWGLLLSQALVQLCYNNWRWPLMVLKQLQMGVGSMLIAGSQEALRLARGRTAHGR